MAELKDKQQTALGGGAARQLAIATRTVTQIHLAKDKKKVVNIVNAS